MALIATLFDDFPGSSLGAAWTTGPAPSAGVCDTSGGGTPLVSAATYTYTGSELIIKLSDGTAYNGNDAGVVCQGPAVNTVGLGRFFGSDKWTVRLYDTGYLNNGTLTFFGGTAQWAKMVFLANGNDIDFYYSPDGVTWTLAYNHTSGSPHGWDGKAVHIDLLPVDQVGAGAPAGRATIRQSVRIARRVVQRRYAMLFGGATKIVAASYTQGCSGSITPTATLFPLAQHVKTFTGAITSSGTLSGAKRQAKAIAGAITSAGTLTLQRTHVVLLTGVAALSGAVTTILTRSGKFIVAAARSVHTRYRRFGS